MSEIDFGTPPRHADTDVTLEIDGAAVTVPAGTSVMRAAAMAGTSIPKLCATDSLEPFGSCRLCLVEIEGVKGTPASCTTPVAEGMKVSTVTDRLSRLRRGLMDLYLSDHPSELGNTDSEMPAIAADLGADGTRFAGGKTHLSRQASPLDASNPYFEFDPEKCIVCSRCVRACADTQGTFALTIEGRGFASKVSAGIASDDFFSSECVSCGACVSACPTDALNEKAIVVKGLPERTVETTCAYCGVGCTFEAQVRGDEVVRMTPAKSGGANEGHSCVKGRFAYGWATHKDRVLTPMIREATTDPWRPVGWDEAIGYAAERFKAIQTEHGVGAIGGITSSRCTNEEVFAVQKMVRTAFGNNNVDTCARVCHSPTGYGLKSTFGTSAGTQDFRSLDHADVILLIGANPTDAHPVFASRIKRRMRQGAKLIVVDPRRIDLVRSPHVEAAFHIPLQPGTNVAVMNAFAHVAVTEDLIDEKFVAERCETQELERWRGFVGEERNSPEALAEAIGVDAETVRAAARLYAGAPNAAIYYGLGVTEHSQGSTMVMAMANLAMATGNIGRDGVGVNPLRGQNNVQGSCDMGSFPHEFPGYRHVSDPEVRGSFETHWGLPLSAEPGLRIPNMFAASLDGSFRALFVQGEDIAQSDPDTQNVTAALQAMDFIVVQDLFLNETAAFAHVFLPGTTFLEKDGTFTNAERRINRVRPVMDQRQGLSEWETVCRLAQAMGYAMHWDSAAEIMDEIAALTPTFAGVSFARLDAEGSMQWPVNDAHPHGTPVMHVGEFVRGKGRFMITEYVPTDERTTRRYPLILTTGRILSQYNVGAQTRRTDNQRWHAEDLAEIHPFDAGERGVSTGDRVSIASRKGAITLTALVTDRVPQGVVYTTFHHPLSGVNVVTTENSDWATQCPEYKVTAVQVRPANEPSRWQSEHEELRRTHYGVAPAAE